LLTQVVQQSTRRGLLLDIVLTNEGLVEDVKAGGSLGCSDNAIVEFRILRGGSRAICKVTASDFRRAKFDFFKYLLRGKL